VGNEGLLPILGLAGFPLLQPRPTFVWQGLFLSVEVGLSRRNVLLTRAGFNEPPGLMGSGHAQEAPAFPAKHCRGLFSLISSLRHT
jgi:hypothetical protein